MWINDINYDYLCFDDMRYETRKGYLLVSLYGSYNYESIFEYYIEKYLSNNRKWVRVYFICA